MTENVTQETAVDTEPFTDPRSLVGRDGIDVDERTYDHEDADHCEADTAGRAIVGVTSDDGAVLLVTHTEDDHAILPNATVEPGADWTDAARAAVEDATGVSVEIDSPLRVRAVDHVLAGDDQLLDSTHHVVFSASPAVARAERAEPAVSDEDWEADWYDEVPEYLDQDGHGVLDDIQLVLD